MPPLDKAKIVLLILPPALIKLGASPALFPPIGLAYLASYVKKSIPEIGISILDAVAEGFPSSFPYRDEYQIVGLDDALFKEQIAAVNPWVESPLVS